MPKRKSWTDEEFVNAVQTSLSKREVLKKLGLIPMGGNYSTFDRAAKRLGLDTSHFTGRGWNVGDRFKSPSPAKPLSAILTVDSTNVSSSHLRKRLLSEGIFAPICAYCGLTEWMGGLIPLELDHINGVRDDNRIENLRLLCPNCHALTPTYRGRNKSRPCDGTSRHDFLKKSCPTGRGGASPPRATNTCKDCSVECSRKATRCKSCAVKHLDRSKIEWPPTDELLELVSSFGHLETGRQLGVSDNAVRKRIRNHSE